MLTERLELRLPLESDRERFVHLFRDEDFMVFSAGVLDRAGAARRFDSMLRRAAAIPFGQAADRRTLDGDGHRVRRRRHVHVRGR